MFDENGPWIDPDRREEEPEQPSGEASAPSEVSEGHVAGWLTSSGEAAVPAADRADAGGAGEGEGKPAVPAPDDTQPMASVPPSAVSDDLSDDFAFGPRGIEEVPEGPPRWWRWVLAIVIEAVVIGMLAVVWWWRVARPIEVPDLTGRQAAEAVQLLNDASLRVGTVSEIATDVVSAGLIVSQKPGSGTTLRPGDAVALVVAAAADASNMPDLVGRTQVSAAAQLALARLRPRVVTTYSTTAGEGAVVSQLPVSGTRLAAGTEVVVVVSKGPAPLSATVPRLTGLSEDESKHLLSSYGLEGAFYHSYDTSVSAGDVITQSPIARASVPFGSLVQVLLSDGPGTGAVTLPNVAGKTQKQATASLDARGLKTSVRTTASETVDSGDVISQMPLAGSLVAAGSEVGLLVSSGPATPVKAPSLIGSSTDVTETISAAGLAPVVVTIPVSGQKAGAVFAQFPEAGQEQLRGQPMVVAIAAAP